MIKLIKRIVLIFVCGLGFCDCFSQTGPGIQWQNTIGGSDWDELYSVMQTSDGGYILGGLSYSNISGDKTENSLGGTDYWVIKLDASGNIQWQNTIGGSLGDDLLFIAQTTDGGYICGGTSGSSISGDKTENCIGAADYWIVKLDGSGNIQWQNTIGGSLTDNFSSIAQTIDGGYICGGYSYSNISGDKTENCLGNFDYWVVKLDSSGTIQWQNTIGGSGTDELFSVSQTADGGYICGGYSNSNISGDKTENNLDPSLMTSDYWVIKLDSSGNIQWQNTIGGNSIDKLLSIYQTSDGGYICGGSSQSNISGDKTENSLGDLDYWIVKLDTSGNIQWQNTIGGNNFDVLNSISTTANGGYICAGHSFSNISGDKTENCLGGLDYWVVKLASDTITSIPNLQSSTFNFQLFPNPTTGTIQLTFNTIHNAPLHCEIINIMGEKVYEKNLEVGGWKLETTLDVSFLGKGIYLVRVGDGEKWENKKLVVE